jgi:hypothetical protein
MIRNILYIYFFVLLLQSIFFDGFREGKKIYLKVFNVTYIFMPLFMAFQYGVGIDTAGYMNFYEYVPKLDKLDYHFLGLTRAQPLFILLCSLCKTITEDFVLIQIVQATLFCHSLYVLLKRLKLRYFFFLFIFYGEVYMGEMSGLRECLALSFCFYALIFYLDKKYLSFYSLVTIGVLFHTGVFIFYLFPLFRLFKKLNTKNVLVTIGFVVVLFILFYNYQIWFSVSELSRGVLESREYRFTSILYFLIILYFVYYYSILKGNDRCPDLIYLGFFSIVLLIAGTLNFEILYRYRAHFIILFFYLIKDTLKNMRSDKIVLYFFILCLAYIPISKFMTVNESHPVIKYYSVFESDKSEKTREIKNGKLPLFIN